MNKYEITYTNTAHGKIVYVSTADNDKELSQVLSQYRTQSKLTAKDQVCTIGRIKSVANTGTKTHHFMCYRYNDKNEIMVIVRPNCKPLAPKYGLKVSYRDYKCDVCGHRHTIQTNHTGNCSSYCKNCSWRSGYDSAGNHYRADIQKHRPHYYVGRGVTSDEINPHALRD